MACLFWTVPRDSKLLAALLVSDPDGADLLACDHVPTPPSLVPAHPQRTSLPRSGCAGHLPVAPIDNCCECLRAESHYASPVLRVRQSDEATQHAAYEIHRFALPRSRLRVPDRERRHLCHPSPTYELVQAPAYRCRSWQFHLVGVDSAALTITRLSI